MKLWTCHKTVYADKIQSVKQYLNGVNDNACELTLEGGEQVTVPLSWAVKHNPESDGYFVRYQDGYESYSPAKAFEEGYTLSPEQPQEEVK